MTVSQFMSAPCCHNGTEQVAVGPYIVRAGGIMYPDFYSSFDEPDLVVVPLTDRVEFGFGCAYDLVWLPLKDFGGVSDEWRQTLEEIIVPRLEAGRTILAFCVAGHGRTGTFLASLIALLEDSAETPDPIETVRQRYCRKAVETRAQIDGILTLRS